MDKIYRFMSIESFIDMVMKKSLTFVHPSRWDDPYEYILLDNLRKMYNYDFIQANSLFNLAHSVFCQSWTKKNESDALWRIYSHNNSSVRVCVKNENIKKLEGVTKKEINYSDNISSEDVKTWDDLYNSITKKRTAFMHEEEVRLIKINPTETQLSFGTNELFKFANTLSLNKNLTVEQTKDIKKFNNCEYVEKIQIPFNNIDNFIDSVMLNPFAPDWFNETLELFCKEYNINYLGKSKLYEIDSEL